MTVKDHENMSKIELENKFIKSNIRNSQKVDIRENTDKKLYSQKQIKHIFQMQRFLVNNINNI